VSTIKEKILALMADGEWRTRVEICQAVPGASTASTISTLATAGKLRRRREEGKELFYQITRKAAKAIPPASRLTLPPMTPLRTPKPPVAALLRSPRVVSPQEKVESIRRRIETEAKLHGGVVSMQIEKQLQNVSIATLYQLAAMIEQMPGCDWHYIMTGEMI